MVAGIRQVLSVCIFRRNARIFLQEVLYKGKWIW